MPLASDLPRKIGKRSRTGCLTCRARKVKCDETPGECEQCYNLGLVCKWQERKDIPVNDVIRRPLQRDRSVSPYHRNMTCDHCRAARALCSKHQPTCVRCSSHSLECQYSGTSRQYQQQQQAQQVQSTALLDASSTQSLIPRYELDHFLEIYFGRVHPMQAHAFLHRSTLLMEVSENKVSPLLLKAIRMVTQRFLDNVDGDDPDGGPTARALVQEVKHGVMGESDSFSTSVLASTLLLIDHEWSCGRYASAWNITALATRMTIGMGLHDGRNYPSNLTWLESESRRRLAWAAFCADAMTNGGLEAYCMLPPDRMSIPLPCSEHTFSKPRNAVIRDTDDTDGITARFVRLIILRFKILRYTKTRSQDSEKPWNVPSPFTDLIDELSAWRDTLPYDMVYTLENLYSHAASPVGLGPFLTLHCWYDQIHTALYLIAYAGVGYQVCSAEDLASAPSDWVDKVQVALYIRATAITDKIKLVSERFPSFIPSSWQYRWLVFGSIKNQLLRIAHLKAKNIIQTEDEHQASLTGFQVMIDFYERQLNRYAGLRVTIREILHMLWSAGFAVTSSLSDVPESPSTPESDRVLKQLPLISRYLHHPTIQTPSISGSDLNRSPALEDPVNLELLASSPKSGTSGLDQPSRVQSDGPHDIGRRDSLDQQADPFAFANAFANVDPSTAWTEGFLSEFAAVWETIGTTSSAPAEMSGPADVPF